MNELVSPFDGHVESSEDVRPSTRAVLAVEALGPLTIVGGIVWAIAQPYRLVFLRETDKGLWDYLGQPPLLVIFVGLLFGLLVAPGLVDDLREVELEADAATAFEGEGAYGTTP